jgi:tetratricopeptide (TPR) repeat protein
VLAAFLPSFAASTAIAAPPPATTEWIVFDLPETAFWSSAPRDQARDAAARFSQFRVAAASRYPFLNWSGGAPVSVFAVPSESALRALAPEFWERGGAAPTSTYSDLGDRVVIGLRTDLRDDDEKKSNPAKDALRGIVSSAILRTWGDKTPEWLGRGLSLLLAESLLREKEVVFGRVPAATLEAARAAEGATSDLFAPARRFNPLVADPARDAVAMLFAHFVLSDPARTARLPELDPAPLRSAFRGWLRGKNIQTERRPLATTIRPAALPSRAATPYEATIERAEILWRMNRPVETRQLAREAKAISPAAPRPHEIEASLYDAEGRGSEARAALEAAANLASRNPTVYYRLAQMSWSRALVASERARIEALLRRAVDLSAGAPSIASRALAYLAEIRLDQADSKEALALASRAVAAEPESAFARLALARAQWSAGAVEAAIGAAEYATRIGNASEQARAKEFLAFVTPKRGERTRRPYMTSQPPPPPPGWASGSALVAAASGSKASAPADRSRDSATVLAGSTRAGGDDSSAIADCFVRRDDAACARAIPSLEVACAEKRGESCTSLGSLHDGGFGTKPDRRRAAAAYRAGCDAGDRAGCARHAVLEAQGLGVPRNASRAMKTLETLCGENVADACLGWGQILSRRVARADREKGAALIKKACDLGRVEACRLAAPR